MSGDNRTPSNMLPVYMPYPSSSASLAQPLVLGQQVLPQAAQLAQLPQLKPQQKNETQLPGIQSLGFAAMPLYITPQQQPQPAQPQQQQMAYAPGPQRVLAAYSPQAQYPQAQYGQVQYGSAQQPQAHAAHRPVHTRAAPTPYSMPRTPPRFIETPSPRMQRLLSPATSPLSTVGRSKTPPTPPHTGAGTSIAPAPAPAPAAVAAVAYPAPAGAVYTNAAQAQVYYQMPHPHAQQLPHAHGHMLAQPQLAPVQLVPCVSSPPTDKYEKEARCNTQRKLADQIKRHMKGDHGLNDDLKELILNSEVAALEYMLATNQTQDLEKQGDLYACPMCPKKFVYYKHGRRHMVHHLGVRPYACTGCDKRFSRKDTGQRHLGRCRGKGAKLDFVLPDANKLN